MLQQRCATKPNGKKDTFRVLKVFFPVNRTVGFGSLRTERMVATDLSPEPPAITGFVFFLPLFIIPSLPVFRGFQGCMRGEKYCSWLIVTNLNCQGA